MITTSMNVRTHDHLWTARSRHQTSAGAVSYEQCRCGRWRIRRDSTVRSGQTLALTEARSG